MHKILTCTSDQPIGAQIPAVKRGILFAAGPRHDKLTPEFGFGRGENPGRIRSLRKHFRIRGVAPVFVLLGLTLAGVACAARLPTAKGSRQAAVRAPVWAVQLKFTYAATIPVQAWPERTFAKIAADGGVPGNHRRGAARRNLRRYPPSPPFIEEAGADRGRRSVQQKRRFAPAILVPTRKGAAN